MALSFFVIIPHFAVKSKENPCKNPEKQAKSQGRWKRKQKNESKL